MHGSRWTRAEDALLRQTLKWTPGAGRPRRGRTSPLRDVAARLGRTYAAVQYRAHVLRTRQKAT